MIDVSEEDGVRILAMRADQNRLNPEFVGALLAGLDALADDGGPVVLVGEGKFFCNGLDLDWMGAADGADAVAMMDDFHGVLARLLDFPGVVVAAVNGHAFGAGAILAAAADFRVQRRDRGYFCFPEVDIGLAMSPAFDAVLRMRYPSQSVLPALLSGHRYGGDEALAAGFVDEVAGETELLAAALGIAGRHREKSPAVVGAIKSVQHAPALAVLR